MNKKRSELLVKAIQDLLEGKHDGVGETSCPPVEEKPADKLFISSYRARGKTREEGKEGMAGSSKTASIFPKPPSRPDKDAKPFPGIDPSDTD